MSLWAVVVAALFSVFLGWLLWYSPINWRRAARRFPGPSWMPWLILSVVLLVVVLVVS